MTDKKEDCSMADCLTLGIVTFVLSSAFFVIFLRIMEIRSFLERGEW